MLHLYLFILLFKLFNIYWFNVHVHTTALMYAPSVLIELLNYLRYDFDMCNCIVPLLG